MEKTQATFDVLFALGGRTPVDEHDARRFVIDRFNGFTSGLGDAWCNKKGGRALSFYVTHSDVKDLGE